MLATTKEEQCAVECVLKGHVDQYTLDGTDRVLKIPRCLLERVEQLPHQVRMRNHFLYLGPDDSHFSYTVKFRTECTQYFSLILDENWL